MVVASAGATACGGGSDAADAERTVAAGLRLLSTTYESVECDPPGDNVYDCTVKAHRERCTARASAMA